MSLAPKDFATRHPIRHAYWAQMSDMTVLGATLYTFGIDPNAWYDELEAQVMEDMPYDELPKDFDERMEIICSAVRAELIKKLPNAPHPFVNADTKIYIKSFFEWLKSSAYANNLASITPTTGTPPSAQAPVIATNTSAPQPTQPSNTISDFDALVVDGIAKIFPLHADPEQNCSIWTKHAKNAVRNGLVDARVSIGKGQAQSTYQPEKVGDWLISKGKMDQAKVNRLLGANLPPRSRDNKHLYE